MKVEIKHWITGAVLFSLECGNVREAVIAAARHGADLQGADLRGAYLRDADLQGANLQGAWNVVMVQVGCKSFTLEQGREYWAGKENRREVMAALDYADAIANIRGWVKK